MNSARQIRLIAMREINTRLRNRAYQFSTLAIALLAAGGVMATQILPDFFEDDPYAFGLVPATVEQEEPLRAAAASFDREVEFVTFEALDAAERALDEDEIDVVLAAPGELRFEGEADATLESIVRQSLFATQLEERAAALGLTLEEAQSLVAPVEVESQSVSAPDGAGDDSSEIGQGIGSLSALALFLAITFYGQWVLVGVIEEKSNRVVEVLLSAVAPWELLAGKVLGILALAVGQLVVGGVAFAAALVLTEGAEALPSVALAGLATAVLWLVIGLLLYNFLYAAVGATVNRPEEATSVSMPLMVPLMAGYFAGLVFIPNDPDSTISRVLSIFPLTAPLTMPSRIASGGGSPFEVAIAVALALATLAGVIWLAGRIYSGGILQSRKVSFMAAFRSARDVR